MKKLLTILFACAFLAFSAIFAVSCEKETGEAADENTGEIYAIYTTYVAYAEENGISPLSYEEWLDTIKGEKGEQGVGISNVFIDENGYLIITLTDNRIINAGNMVAPAGKLDDGNKISFKSFSVNDKSVSGKVSNDTEIFHFNDEIEIKGNAGYKVFNDFNCEQEILSKTVHLSVGDNLFYVLEYCGEYSNFYTVNVRRKPIYTVTFDSNGGSECESQNVEEDAFAVDPKPVLNGYGYTWDYDLSTPITEDITITATWQAIFITRYMNNSTIYELCGLTDYGKTLTEIVIPESIDGIEITILDYFSIGMLNDANVELTKIIIASSVELIGEGAFSGGTYGNPLGKFNNLQYNEYENGLYLGNEDNPYLIFIKPKYTDLTSLTINENTRIVSRILLYNYQDLIELNISNNISDIHFTTGTNKIETVNYSGTMAQWKEITHNSYAWAQNYSSQLMIVHCNDGDLGFNN